MPVLGQKVGERMAVPGRESASIVIPIDAPVETGFSKEWASMNGADRTARHPDVLLEELAAELAAAAHSIALRRGVGGR